MRKRLLGLLMAVVLLCSGVCVSYAEGGAGDPVSDPVLSASASFTSIADPSLKMEEAVTYSYSYSSTVDAPLMYSLSSYSTDEEILLEQLRTALYSWSSGVTLRHVVYMNGNPLTEEWFRAQAQKGKDWFNQVLDENQEPCGGDYLRWSYDELGISIHLTYDSDLDACFFDYEYSFIYYTTPAQEAALTAEINKVFHELGVKTMASDYLKTKAVYDYICKNIYYDEAGLDNDADVLKFSAYGALVEKSAVCQGYATLFHRMLRELGIECRIIVGMGNNEAHAWNIVKLGDVYYLADPTWDSDRAHWNVDYAYFLRGSDYFLGHSAAHDYHTEAFVAKHPISATDYVYSEGFNSYNFDRLYGPTRYETSYKIADALKEELGVEKFSAVVIASGLDFPDALAGNYLAARNKAPILMVNGKDQKNIAALKAYVQANLTSNGKIYILGGTNAVSSAVETAMESCSVNVERLSGATRYETNIEILKEAKVDGDELLICTGAGFADSLAASATGHPILLVNPNGSLSKAQKDYLATLNGKEIHIIGGEAAIPDRYSDALAPYSNGTVYRYYGENRYMTAIKLAEFYYPEADRAVVAYAWTFPDGLCGGSLACAMGSPLFLTRTGDEGIVAGYALTAGMEEGYVLGGTKLISNEAANRIFPAY